MASPTDISMSGIEAPRSFGGRRLQAFLGRDWRTAIPFVLPMVLIMLGLILWPLIDAVLLSTTAFNFLTGETVNVGLKNFQRLFSDPEYARIMQNTFVFTLFSLAIKLATGLTIAVILNSRLPFRNVLSGLMLLPWIVPEIVTALAWKSIFDPMFGGLNPILQGAGLIQQPIGWLSEPQMAMGSIIAVNVWKGIPFYTLLLLAGLKAIDREQLEAAEVDGANAVQRFRHVVLPGLKYVILVTLLLSFISTFNQFGLIYLMTGGGPGGATKLYSILAYEKAIGALQYGQGSAIALSVAPLMAVLIWLLAIFMRRDERRVPNGRESGAIAKLARAAGRVFSALLDLVFLPFEWVVRGFEQLALVLRGMFGRARHQPLLTRAGRERSGIAGRLLVLFPILVFVLFPFYWIISTSLKSTSQITERRSLFWPDPATLDQYVSLIQTTSFGSWFRMSMSVAAVSTVLSVGLAALSAYALSRLRFLGAGLLTTFLLITYLLPGTLIFIPLYQTLTALGIINTWWALVITYPTFLLPFATWVMIGYFRSIPIELDEAAMIDGAGRLYVFWRIILPLAAPALLAVTLFAFTNAWNEFLFAFVFVTSESLRTLPIGLQSLVIGDVLPWGELMAASLLTAVPVTILYIYAQRFLVGGLTVGGVKG